MKSKSQKLLRTSRLAPKKNLQTNVRRAVTRAETRKDGGLRRTINNVLDDSEQQLNVIGRNIKSMTKRMESKAIGEINGFEQRWSRAQHWLKDRLQQVRTVEQKVERIIDTTVVQAHLAKMETQDKVAEVNFRYEKMRLGMASLRSKTVEKTVQALDLVSHACLVLKHKLESRRSSIKG